MLTFSNLKVCLLEVILNNSGLFHYPTQSNFKLQTLGCFPTENPSIGSWKADIADLWVFIVLYSNPNSNISARKSNTSFGWLIKGCQFASYDTS